MRGFEHNTIEPVSPKPSHSISSTRLHPLSVLLEVFEGAGVVIMGREGQDGSAALPGMRMQRSQSRLSLSASFEALAAYFPCMNSFDKTDGGKDKATCQV